MELCMVSAEEIPWYVRQQDAVLVDLRSREDYQEFHIVGSINIPLEQLPHYMHRSDKSRLHIFCCQYGSMSIYEGRKYLRQGYRICSLAGGVDGYRERGYC